MMITFLLGDAEKSNLCAKITLDQEELNYFSKIVNPTKKTKNTHYTPGIWGEMNGGIGMAKFNSLWILRDSGASYSIILAKHTKNCEGKWPSWYVGLHK